MFESLLAHSYFKFSFWILISHVVSLPFLVRSLLNPVLILVSDFLLCCFFFLACLLCVQCCEVVGDYTMAWEAFRRTIELVFTSETVSIS